MRINHLGKIFPARYVQLAVLLLAFLGCRGNDGTYPVTGSVTIKDASPLAGATIMFHSADGSVYTTVADADGKFVIRAKMNSIGLPPGNYQVVVQEPLPDDIDRPTPPKIHPKYTSASSTDLQVTVDKQDNVFDLVLDPPA